MEQLVITIEGKSNTDLLMRLLTKFNFVKSISRQTTAKEGKVEQKVVNEPAEKYNWTNPSRTATDEEFERLIAECETSPLMTSEEAQKHTLKLLNEWSKQKK